MSERWPEALQAALADAAPPPHWPAPLSALWWLARNRQPDGAAWERAHALVQDASGPEAAWVHAHLHRVEGDAGNARYWYARAGREPATGDPADELVAIAAALV